jgi:uncharacterized protein
MPTPLPFALSAVEARILGALIEKEKATPEYYPLSLNALVNACNQKSNRDPVMNLSEDEVRQALRSMQDNSLVRSVSPADSRVTKYEHRLQEVFNFDRREAALVCELLLRGAQTPGELRSRAERMHHFDELGEVQSTLQRLMNRQPPIVALLARQPGTKESRYAHLLSGDTEVFAGAESHGVSRATVAGDHGMHGGRLETEITQLRSEIAELRREVAELKKRLPE